MALSRKISFVLALGLFTTPAFADPTPAPAASPAPTATTAASDDMLHITITQGREEMRNELSPTTGTSAYKIDDHAIASMPQGDNTSFDKILEQAPGVTQDSYGQTHVRGEHADLQYRINGILLPEGISGFGQTLDPRIMKSMTLLDGALPAQYGYRTAGVVDIETKTGFENGGVAEFLGGSNGTIQPSVMYAGVQGPVDYFFTASHLSSDLGIESPTPQPKAIHDHTEQDKQFGYASYMINPMQRVEVIAGSSTGYFEIPNNPGQPQNFALDGVPTFNSLSLNERQYESNQYATAAWQGGKDGATLQIAPYIRSSETHFEPDVAGDLIFNGVASDVMRRDLAVGLQADGSWRANATHTLRAGFSAQNEQATSDNTSQVFDITGGVTATTPTTIVDNHQINAQLYGMYLQDEWKLTDDLKMNYGARFDVSEAYRSEHQLSPRIGFVYKLNDSTKLHAGYARYFTPPPLELIAPSSIGKFDNTTNQAANPQDNTVKSERSNNYDLGITHQLTDEISLGVDGYYKQVHNLLDEGQFGQALVYTPFNYEYGKIYGVEFTSSYTTKNLKAYANLAVSKAMGENITSAQFNFDPAELAFIQNNFVHLDHDQTYTGSAGVSYQILPKTAVDMDGILGSGLRSGFVNSEHLPWYTQINVGATEDLDLFPHDKTQLRLSVVNLFDSSYELRDGTGIGVGAPQWGPRRGYYASLSQAF